MATRKIASGTGDAKDHEAEEYEEEGGRFGN